MIRKKKAKTPAPLRCLINWLLIWFPFYPRRAPVLEVWSTLPGHPAQRKDLRPMITFTKPGTASSISFVPLDKPRADGGQPVKVDGEPVVNLSAELVGVIVYTPDEGGFSGKLTAAADLGDAVLSGTLQATIDADLGEGVVPIVGVLDIVVSPEAKRATIVEITATDPA